MQVRLHRISIFGYIFKTSHCEHISQRAQFATGHLISGKFAASRQTLAKLDLLIILPILKTQMSETRTITQSDKVANRVAIVKLD